MANNTKMRDGSFLRYEQTVNDAGAEYWQMRLVREKSLHRVLNPQLTDEQIDGVSQQLGAILQGDVAAELEQAGLDASDATEGEHA